MRTRSLRRVTASDLLPVLGLVLLVLAAGYLLIYNIFYISTEDISRVSYLTGKREVLIEAPQLSSVAYDGQNIYYLNERFRLVKFSLAEQEGQVMSDKIMRVFQQ